VIAGKDEEFRILLAGQDHLGGGSDGSRRVAPDRLPDEVAYRLARAQGRHLRAQRLPRDHPAALRRDLQGDPAQRVLEERLRAQELEELLGTLSAAERPESFAPASGEDDGVKNELAHRTVSIQAF